MIILTFKHKGYNRNIELIDDTFKSIYYDLGELLNGSEPTFEEDIFIANEVNSFNEIIYDKLIEEDENKAIEYWNQAKEYITEENYKSFIEDVFIGKGYKKEEYTLQFHNVYYFDEIIDYFNLKFNLKDLERVNNSLLKTGKVKKDWNDRLYTEDYNLYKQLEIELEDN